jgi:hypothetical protein
MNKKRLIHGFATFYIVAAILVAHSALATLETTAPDGLDRQAEVGAPALVVRDHLRLDEPDPQEYNRHTRALHADRAARADAARADDADGASGTSGADEAAEGQATEAERAEARPADRAIRAEYTVRIWTSKSCSACQKYKRLELSSLAKMGYEVELCDYDKDDPPDDITSLPTIQLIHDGEVIASKGYWKAKDIDKFVTDRLKLKDS